MLLKKRYGRPLSALSLSLALAFAPLFNVQAAEPEVVPGDSSATPGELSVALSQSDGQSPAVAKLAGEQPLSMEAAANSRAQIEALLPAGYKPVFMNPLVSLYAARDMKPMWENREAVQAFQQQLAEIAIAGFQPQFTTWVSLLTDPAVSGMARDVVLSDAMMGYLHFISGIPTQGTRWLYSSTPYKMATPPLSVINQWQLALDNGSLPAFIAGLAPRHPQYEAMHQSLLALVADSRPWPQMTGSGSLRPGEWSNDIGALNNVVVNPPWNVPPTLARKDILPKVRNNPGYLEQHGYTVMRGWNSKETIDPYRVDWSTITENNLPFRFQQAPGARNSLGRYKFNMPSSDAIYLHDTPNHNLFQKDVRALSSGCVRVNKASELANMLLQDAGWNDTRISDALKQGDTRYVNIRQNIPVNLYYLTAFVDADGRTQYRTDIYNYDITARSSAQILTKAEQLIR
ncbi:unnamed protein product [Klebsiella pneumoniae subsp. rhinoscleromatis SB3432]|nr:L,D-transpeptidase [Klebsiella pneumoniae]CCI77854.1 unnamed protein product [Klebsiella pneumoniae subsp. rhinoscleromatis SB3432]STV58397.1 L,D-transpeptidase YcbB [Klebsiella pneumoniae subsp. rhinoscleromatis]STT67747.1 L,D-transpeptidase YcbB [Klebsiella pneumoniae]STU11434.1 L,D-transpeptidase YcbB [Klebsiella pneumoniae]VTT34672.1 L,D-transpeptidase YcbB [Klebsiella pneumoniae]